MSDDKSLSEMVRELGPPKTEPKRWAKYSDLKDIDLDLMDKAVEASYYYVWDACNLVFELSSSTSGMYASWHINVSPSCTVHLNYPAPRGSGGHINDALQNFIESCAANKAKVEQMLEERKREKLNVQTPRS